jgi:hypothetical protein
MDENLFKAVIYCGKEYRKNHLGAYSREDVKSDYWQGLVFFFDHIFYQGRLDTVSIRVRNAAVDVLEQTMFRHTPIGEERDYRNLDTALSQVIGKGYVGKRRDIDMTISALHYIAHLPKCNLTQYAIRKIEAGEIAQLYAELDSIQQIGPKIASFYLRDLVSLFDLEKCLADEVQIWLQPVDVWVERLAQSIGLVAINATHAQIQQAIIDLCREKGYSPLLFNQGAWYMGYNSFNLLLDFAKRKGLE